MSAREEPFRGRDSNTPLILYFEVDLIVIIFLKFREIKIIFYYLAVIL